MRVSRIPSRKETFFGLGATCGHFSQFFRIFFAFFGFPYSSLLFPLIFSHFLDFSRIFSRLIQFGYHSWAVMEWECCIKSPEQGAAKGAPFIASHMIDVTEAAFDDFAGGVRDDAQIKRMLGL